MGVSGISSPIDDATAKATQFLRERLRSGHYGLSCIGNDGSPRFSDNKGHVFVASFIADAMHGLLDEIDRTIILVRILSEENEGRWGFSPPGPCHMAEFLIFHVDSDDTAYVIRTLRRLGVNRTPQSLMHFYREAERLFVTFDGPGPASLTTFLTAPNNLLAHPEVNANIWLALQGTHFAHIVNYEALIAAQHKDGFWESYFYPNPLFGTLLSLEVLRDNCAFAATTDRALAFILDRQNPEGHWGADGDPYETALAVAALAIHQAHPEEMRRGVDYLLATMATDGSWTSEACIWQFPAGNGELWRAFDLHRAYVSARCLIALRRASGQLSSLP